MGAFYRLSSNTLRNNDTVWSLDFQVEVEVYACAGFLLFEERKYLYTTIEILRVHTLTLPLENLKLPSA